MHEVYYREQTKVLNKNELNLVHECAEDLKKYPDSEFDYGVHNRYLFCSNDYGDDVIGVLIYYENVDGGLWLSKIYVKPEHRREGIASKLFSYLLLLNKTIDLGIYPLNEISMAFFKGLGVEPISTICRKRV